MNQRPAANVGKASPRSKANADVSASASKPRNHAHRPKQLSLPRTGGWGGKRKGAGRRQKRRGRRNVPHLPRPPHKGRHPVHVTLRAKAGLPSFRQQLVQRMLAEVLRDQRARYYESTFRVLHYSIQRDHLHVVVEADTERAEDYRPLRSGISGLAIAFARRLNMMLRRRGSVWADRYHRRDLKSPTEMRHALGYVFQNYLHHGWRKCGDGTVDPFSTAPLFEGWDGFHFVPAESERWRWFVCRPRTWLAASGYLRIGRLPLTPDPRTFAP